MLPITGPYTRLTEQSVEDSPPYRNVLSCVYTRGYRQRRPYDRPLPFDFRARKTIVASNWSFMQAENAAGGVSNWKAFDVNSHTFGDGGDTYIARVVGEVLQKARARFSDLLNDTASTLTALVEARSTLAMVTNVLSRFTRFTQKMKRGSYKAAIREVLEAQSFKSKGKERARVRRLRRLMEAPRQQRNKMVRDIGSAWLETWFGWLPTVGDVMKSLEILDRDFPPDLLKGSARMLFSTSGEPTNSHKGTVFAKCGASIKVTNPNLFLASQLGLINPVLTAVEVIPYSWLLGWFVNLDQYFKQFTEFMGVTVEHPWHLYGMQDTCRNDYSYHSWADKPIGVQTCWSYTRTLGLPDVELRWRGLSRLSPTRGATLASLLVQYLPKR